MCFKHNVFLDADWEKYDKDNYINRPDSVTLSSWDWYLHGNQCKQRDCINAVHFFQSVLNAN